MGGVCEGEGKEGGGREGLKFGFGGHNICMCLPHTPPLPPHLLGRKLAEYRGQVVSVVSKR